MLPAYAVHAPQLPMPGRLSLLGPALAGGPLPCCQVSEELRFAGYSAWRGTVLEAMPLTAPRPYMPSITDFAHACAPPNARNPRQEELPAETVRLVHEAR